MTEQTALDKLQAAYAEFRLSPSHEMVLFHVVNGDVEEAIRLVFVGAFNDGMEAARPSKDQSEVRE